MKINNLKFGYYFFLSVGILALTDKLTGTIFYDNSFGAVSHFVILLFGASVAEIAVIFSDLVLIWLGLAYVLYRKSKVKENPSKENKKYYKIAKIIALIIGALFLVGVLLAFLHVQRIPTSENTEVEVQKSTIPRMPQPIGLTVEEQVDSWNRNLVIFREKAVEMGFSEDEIDTEVQRALDKWRPSLEKLKNTESQNEMCNHSKKLVLNEAFEYGITDVDELEKVSRTYELLCGD